VVLSLIEILYQGYRLTLDNYYTSPEISIALFNQKTDCYGTLKKKENLPPDFWQWKPMMEILQKSNSTMKLWYWYGDGTI